MSYTIKSPDYRMKIRLPKLIAFSGKAGGGKTTMCNMLEAWLLRFGITPFRISFAEPIYEDIARLYFEYFLKAINSYIPLSEDDVIAWMRNNKHYYVEPAGMTLRNLLQWYGTNLWRDRDEHVWLRAYQQGAENINKISLYPVVILTDDVRFVNEAERIQQDLQGVLIRLLRGNTADEHESENALDSYHGFNLTIDNRNQTPDETFADIIKYLEAR